MCELMYLPSGTTLNNANGSVTNGSKSDYWLLVGDVAWRTSVEHGLEDLTMLITERSEDLMRQD